MEALAAASPVVCGYRCIKSVPADRMAGRKVLKMKANDVFVVD